MKSVHNLRIVSIFKANKNIPNQWLFIGDTEGDFQNKVPVFNKTRVMPNSTYDKATRNKRLNGLVTFYEDDKHIYKVLRVEN